MPIIGTAFQNSKIVTSSTACDNFSSEAPSTEDVYSVWQCDNVSCTVGVELFGTIDDGTGKVTVGYPLGDTTVITVSIGTAENPFPSGHFLKITLGNSLYDQYESTSTYLTQVVPYGSISGAPQDAISFPTSTPYWVKTGCTIGDACNTDDIATYPCDCGNVENLCCEYPETNFDCDGNCTVDIDCNGVCGGSSVIDECGICDGSGAVYNCGNYSFDCGDGGHCSSDIYDGATCFNFDDCGTCNSVSTLSCAINSGLNSIGEECGGIGQGNHQYCENNYFDDCKVVDQCGVCGGNGTSCMGCNDSEACNYDSDVPVGDSYTSNCEYNDGVAYCQDEDNDGFGNPQVHAFFCNAAEALIDGYVADCSDTDDDCFSDYHDCAGVCDGLKNIDECGQCNLPNNMNQDMDDCGECFGVNINLPYSAVNNSVVTSYCEYRGFNCGDTSDACQVPHSCGTCSQPNPVCVNNVCVCDTEQYAIGCDSNCNNPPTIFDCNGVCGGTAGYDIHQNINECPPEHCVGGDSMNLPCVQDCNNRWYVEGQTPRYTEDCFGYCDTPSGPNTTDPHGTCCLASSILTYYLDTDGDGLGDGGEGIQYCAGTQPDNFVPNNIDTCVGSNTIDACGTCIDGTQGDDYECCVDTSACNTYVTETCVLAAANYDCDGNCINDDCLGVCGGQAVLNVCNVCVGNGTDYSTESTIGEDCSGICFGGTIFDCNGDCGGIAVLDDCNVCGGDNSLCSGCMDSTACNYDSIATIVCDTMFENDCCTYPVNVFRDCLGNCLPSDNSQTGDDDNDGICNGEDSFPDCNANFLDVCGVCGGDGIADGACDCDGNVDLGCGCGMSAPTDCPTFDDDNEYCGTGTYCSSEDECAKNPFYNSGDPFCDCSGNPQGTYCNCLGDTYDDCGVCNGDNSTCLGCDDVPNSGWVLDECGVCNGSGACNCGDIDNTLSCVCCDWLDFDEDGIHNEYDDCVGEMMGCGCNTPIPDGACDCDGNVDLGCGCNNEELDDCGICGGPGIGTSNNCNYDNCCDGTCACPGSCQVCGCTDVTACNYNSDAVVDDNSCYYPVENYNCAFECCTDQDSECSNTATIVDCNGICGGTAWESDCGCVAADNTGDDCDDCEGIPNGDAYVSTWYYDGDGDGLGCPEAIDGEGEPFTGCSNLVPDSYVENMGESNVANCSCSTNNTDDCGVCGGENNSQDCTGTCGGTSTVDDCGICNGGNQDIDDCGICFGTGKFPCWNGEEYCDIDECINPVPGCPEPDACNYVEGATLHTNCLYSEDVCGSNIYTCNGSTDYNDCTCNDSDGDGICDDIDNCDGVVQECGCNIPIADGKCNCHGDVLDECGVCGGNGPNFSCWDGENIICPPGTPNPGNCPTQIWGCTYSNACNYNIEANSDDGSCEYPPMGYGCDCTNNTLNTYYFDADGDEIGCSSNSLQACTQPTGYVTVGGGEETAAACLCSGNYDCLGVCNGTAVVNNGCDECGQPNSGLVSCWNDELVCPDACPTPVAGCMDSTACGYNQSANVDDGSCWHVTTSITCYEDRTSPPDGYYETEISNVPVTCENPTCESYGSSIGKLYSSSESISYGCTTVNACNYLSTADEDDGTCTYSTSFCDCLGEKLTDNISCDCNGNFEGNFCNCNGDVPVTYCLNGDIETLFFSCDDPIGTWNTIDGCSYCGNGTIGCDGICDSDLTDCGCGCGQPCVDSDNDGELDCWDDCISDGHINLNEYGLDCLGVCNGNTEIDECGVCGGNGPASGYNCDGVCLSDYDCDGNCGGTYLINDCGQCVNDGTTGIPQTGCGDDFLSPACDCSGNCLDNCGVCNGPNEQYQCFDNTIVCNSYDCATVVTGCTDDQACNYKESANLDDGSCYYAVENYDCDGDCTVVIDCLGVCDGNATIDDCGICGGGGELIQCWDGSSACSVVSCPDVVWGCTDPDACNYDVTATDDNGWCYDTYNNAGIYECDGITCISDSDDDGICDGLEMVGCTDETACNYDASATDDDGSCLDFDYCNICGGDCVQYVSSSCIEMDDCGVCFGPGGTIECLDGSFVCPGTNCPNIEDYEDGYEAGYTTAIDDFPADFIKGGDWTLAHQQFIAFTLPPKCGDRYGLPECLNEDLVCAGDPDSDDTCVNEGVPCGSDTCDSCGVCAQYETDRTLKNSVFGNFDDSEPTNLFTIGDRLFTRQGDDETGSVSFYAIFYTSQSNLQYTTNYSEDAWFEPAGNNYLEPGRGYWIATAEDLWLKWSNE